MICYRRQLLVIAASAGFALCAAGSAVAQTYPAKPITIVVAYPAGGDTDAMARVYAEKLSTRLGQPVVVENRAGATGMIAADLVARSAPDGYTLLMGESGLLIAPHLQATSPVDPLKALGPVAGTFVAPLILVAHNNLPARNPKELIALLKEEVEG